MTEQALLVMVTAQSAVDTVMHSVLRLGEVSAAVAEDIGPVPT